jgi:class 3 adenylate cyclase
VGGFSIVPREPNTRRRTPRVPRPTGVVTFLLTDVEGSTELWDREPDSMRQAPARHDAVVKACVQRHHGHIVKSKGEGDSVFAVFERACATRSPPRWC